MRFERRIYLSSGGEFELQVDDAVDKICRKAILALEEVCEELEFPTDIRRYRERRKGPAISSVPFSSQYSIKNGQELPDRVGFIFLPKGSNLAMRLGHVSRRKSPVAIVASVALLRGQVWGSLGIRYQQLVD